MNKPMLRREFLARTSKLAAAAAVFPRLASGEAAQSMGAQLERLIPKIMKDGEVPGVSLALLWDGRLAWEGVFGLRNNETKAPVTRETLFEAASVSKTVFAYAVLKLCERGVLDLDKPLTKYTPMRMVEGDPRLDSITARHVLSHTTGFQDWRSRREPLKIHFTPGEKYLYSGEGYYYLQCVVSWLLGKTGLQPCARYEADLEVCSTDFDAFMKRHLLHGFGMKSSTYLLNAHALSRAAHGHDRAGTPFKKGAPRGCDVARYGSAGGLQTTAVEYAKFFAAVLNPSGSTRFRMGAKMVEEMLRPQIALTDPKVDGATWWGLGWGIREEKSGKVIVHSGGQEGFRSLAIGNVEKRSGFVIFTNGDNGTKVIFDPVFLEVVGPLLE